MLVQIYYLMEQALKHFSKPPENGGFPNESYNITHTKECDDGTVLTLQNDIVLIKFCQIDEPSMKFWRGLSRASASGGTLFPNH